VLGMKIKHHEDNIKLLKSHKYKLDDSILDLQGILNFLFSTCSSWIIKILLKQWKLIKRLKHIYQNHATKLDEGSSEHIFIISIFKTSPISE
jgi:hypothetical protein